LFKAEIVPACQASTQWAGRNRLIVNNMVG
jgi:hypothetical protein